MALAAVFHAETVAARVLKDALPSVVRLAAADFSAAGALRLHLAPRPSPLRDPCRTGCTGESAPWTSGRRQADVIGQCQEARSSGAVCAPIWPY